MTTYLTTYTDLRPKFDEMSIVKRGKDMNALLYDLLSTRSPYGHEDNIRTIIQKFLAEMNRYTALVNTEVQTYVQNFQNNAQKFQNAQVQQVKLQSDYDKGIQLLRGA